VIFVRLALTGLGLTGLELIGLALVGLTLIGLPFIGINMWGERQKVRRESEFSAFSGHLTPHGIKKCRTRKFVSD
jgi:hypothetical protein